MYSISLTYFKVMYNFIGVTSYGALGHVPPGLPTV